MTDTLPLLLPTVQCDACAATYTGQTLARAVIGSEFHFNPRHEHGHRRLCRDRAKAAGWQR